MTDRLAETVWIASSADEGTISATGANKVAAAIREKFHLLERREEPVTPVAYALRSGPYLLDEHAGVMIDSSGNYNVKTRGNAIALVVLLRAIADDIEDDIELGLKPVPVVVQHERYDPACSEYRPPRGPDSQFLHDYNRGKSCPICIGQAPDRGAQGYEPTQQTPAGVSIAGLPTTATAPAGHHPAQRED